MIMTKQKIQSLLLQMKEIIKENFRFATLSFIFIILFVNVFQKIFGLENSIVGVIFTIMMSASMARDLTGTPIKNFFIQAFVLVLMACSACFVTNTHSILSLLVNFITLFIILYAFTYEYATHLYFPYILSYLFLVFLSPISPSQLPKRLTAMITGAVCIILYQLFMGRKRVIETSQDVLLLMLDEASQSIHCLLDNQKVSINPEELRHNLCRLSRLVYERRRKILQISDASFAVVDSGRGLENLILSLCDLNEALTPEYEKLLHKLLEQLENFRAYIKKDTDTLLPITPESFFENIHIENEKVNELYKNIKYIHNHLLIMTHPKAKEHYHKTALSISIRLKAAMDISSVRIVYALRASLLLAAFTFFVQMLQLPHGKWLLFTIASLSLPYADDFTPKAKKRFIATALGGVISVIAYSLIPSAIGRTVIMMFSGYLSFYLSDYAGTFTCSTIGALGGAVSAGVFGFSQTGQIFFIRISYIIVGILIAFVANCIIFPYKRGTATKQLWKKYASTTELLTRICKGNEIDLQLYYSLVIQAHLQEDKICQNAKAEGWEKMQDLLTECRSAVRTAHHKAAIAE